jgi:molecular chaperone DnaK
MVKDAEAHAGEDKKRREMIEARNQGDALIHSTEKALSEHGDKVDASQKQAIETAIANLKEAVKGDDTDDIKAKTNALAQASMKLGEAMYKAQQAGGAAPGEGAAADGSGDAHQDNVVDADFEEVDEDKKGAA